MPVHGPQGDRGSATDKLRAALVYMVTCASVPGDGEYGQMEQALSHAGADLAALGYVRRMRRMKLTGRSGADLHVAACSSH